MPLPRCSRCWTSSASSRPNSVAARRVAGYDRVVTSEVLLVGIMALGHFLGLAALIAIMVRGDGVNWSSLWPADEDDSGGGGGGGGPSPDEPEGDAGLRLPLDGGSPGSGRLREPRPLQAPRPARRGHEPAPERLPATPPHLR